MTSIRAHRRPQLARLHLLVEQTPLCRGHSGPRASVSVPQESQCRACLPSAGLCVPCTPIQSPGLKMPMWSGRRARPPTLCFVQAPGHPWSIVRGPRGSAGPCALTSLVTAPCAHTCVPLSRDSGGALQRSATRRVGQESVGAEGRDGHGRPVDFVVLGPGSAGSVWRQSCFGRPLSLPRRPSTGRMRPTPLVEAPLLRQGPWSSK